jgi:transposase
LRSWFRPQNFLFPQRDQPLLLPAGMREWLPEDDLVFIVLDAVATLDLGGFRRRYRAGGHGRAAFDPEMMVALLLYGYCQGERSSRVIERRCVRDVGYRVITGGLRPDHATIARFRARHQKALGGLFKGPPAAKTEDRARPRPGSPYLLPGSTPHGFARHTGLCSGSLGGRPHLPLRHEVPLCEWTRGLEADDVGRVVPGACSRPGPALSCAAGNGGVRSTGESPRASRPIRGVTGEGQTGRVNRVNPR